MIEQFKQLQTALARHSTVAIVTHIRPDGDALGSSLAMKRYCDARGISARAYCFDDTPAYLAFLPDTQQIAHTQDDFWDSAEAYLIVDCGDRSMIGSAHDALNEAKPVYVIDHHATNQGYGAVNVINPDASATAEIIHQLFIHTGHAINHEVATQLFTGIYTDTDSFTNLGTTPGALSSSSELLARGAQFKDIMANTMRSKTIPALKLWGLALSRLRLDREKGIAVTVLRRDDLETCHAKPEDMEGVANLLNHLADVSMSMVLREMGDGTVKGSLRTTSDRVDVSKVAQLLGGGGHAKAAGFTVKGSVVESPEGWKIVE